MVYDYAVKHNGIFYPAGANVPVEVNTTVEIKKEEPKTAESGSKEPEKTENKPVKTKVGSKRTKK